MRFSEAGRGTAHDRKIMKAVSGLVALAVLLSAPDSSASTQTAMDDLPIVTLAADGTGPLALILTGDGDWSGFERTLADSLTRYGMPVLGVKMRVYLEKARSPGETATDIGHALETWMGRWHRDRFVLIGYSRGANIAPFVLKRLPAELRSDVVGVALVGLEDHAGFQFHAIDLVADRHRPTDLQVAPEIEGLRGLNAICIYGTGEKHPFCPQAAGDLMRTFEHGGGHRVSGAADGITTTIIIDQLGLRTAVGDHCGQAGG
jgi:type IV secretory pathway VirJ component